LELKAEKDNAEVRITDPDQYQSIVDAEWNIIYVPRLQTNCRIILFKEVQCTADALSVDASTFSTVRSIMISSSSSSVISAPARRSWS
jgi:hypothetical protein